MLPFDNLLQVVIWDIVLPQDLLQHIKLVIVALKLSQIRKSCFKICDLCKTTLFRGRAYTSRLSLSFVKTDLQCCKLDILAAFSPMDIYSVCSMLDLWAKVKLVLAKLKQYTLTLGTASSFQHFKAMNLNDECKSNSPGMPVRLQRSVHHCDGALLALCKCSMAIATNARQCTLLRSCRSSRSSSFLYECIPIKFGGSHSWGQHITIFEGCRKKIWLLNFDVCMVVWPNLKETFSSLRPFSSIDDACLYATVDSS